MWAVERQQSIYEITYFLTPGEPNSYSCENLSGQTFGQIFKPIEQKLWALEHPHGNSLI